MIVALLTIVALAGVALTLLGLRGRRVDAHPLCRRCGFDLFGNPGAETCTECGADLTRPGATRVGRRVRRVRLLTAGLALLAPAAVALAVVAFGATSGADWQSHKPLAWLRYELGAARPDEAAAGELLRREARKKLSDAVWLDLTAAALRAQADPSAAWTNTAWPQVLGVAMGRNALDHDQWQRYTLTALGMTSGGPSTRPVEANSCLEYRTAAGDDQLRLTGLSRLDADVTAAVLERALAFQASRNNLWYLSPWPVILRQAIDLRLLDHMQRRRYFVQAIPLMAATRPVVRRGDPFAFKVIASDGFTAEGDEVLAMVDWLGVVAAGETLVSPEAAQRNSALLVTFSGRGGWQMWTLPAHTADWPLGEATVAGRFHLRIGRNSPPDSLDPPAGLFPGVVEAETDVTLRETFLVIDPDDRRSWVVTDEAQRPVVEGAVLVSPIHWDAKNGCFMMEVRMRERPGVANPPAVVSAKPVLRDGDREVGLDIGQVWVGLQPWNVTQSVAFYVTPWPTPSGELDADLQKVDLVLRPDIAYLATLPNDEPVWGREIVVRGVPIYRDGPRAADEWYGVDGRVIWKPD